MRRKNASSEPFSWKSVFRWPVFLIANAAIFLLVGVSTLRETYRGWTVEREISALQSQADSLEGRKLKLATLTESLSSPERVEIEARQRLGWKKDGERVFVMTGYATTSSLTAKDPQDMFTPTTESFPSNPELWWQYLFGHT